MHHHQVHAARSIETQPTERNPGDETASLTGIWKGGVFAISTAAGMAAIGGTLGTVGALTGAILGAILIALLYFLDRAHGPRRHYYAER